METQKVKFDLVIPPGEIDYLDEKLRQDSPLTVKGTAEVLGISQEIRVQGRLSVRMVAVCDRCLEDAIYPLEQDFDLFYRPAPLKGEEADETALDAGAVEVAFYEGGGLELKEVLKEQVLLALPMRRVCSAECKGICPLCGQNRNHTECACNTKPTDDRWAALHNLKRS
jgi:uncharacterized protein